MIAILLWLLSSALLAYFIFLCIKATALIKRELGMFAAIIFLVGIVSCSSGVNRQAITAPKQWKFIEDSLANLGQYENVRLESNPLFALRLSCLYGYRPNENEPIPVSAKCLPTGLTGNITWLSDTISIQKTSSAFTFHYEVTGVLKWKVLNYTCWTQRKIYEGEIHIGDPN